METAYSPSLFEKDIYKKWEENGVFKAKKNPEGKTHINILPPPNANGTLHIGHASGYTIMDIAGRFERMRGKETLLLPGKDHAGILTQVVYEREVLAPQKKTRKDMKREDFYNDCYDFCIEKSALMREQEKRIGLSADWSEEKFTLDPKITDLVQNTFIKMYEDGLAYRGERIINWCPHCETALSDLEVENKDTDGFLYEIAYPLKEGGEIRVETTRPITMLGDTAVAVHPEDERYTHLIGKTVILPLTKREVPIIADKEIDKEFGSGAVKITPAHDALDFRIGKRHNLDIISVITEKNTIAEGYESLSGKDIFTAHDEILVLLEKEGALKGKKPHTVPFPVHERCKKNVEKIVSPQWWIDVDHPNFSLKKKALEVLENDEIRIEPAHCKHEFLRWINNLEDWCISRQIWWSERFPVWYKGEEIQVQKDSPGNGWVQDEDTFDTWFSSGQWAYASLFPFLKESYYPSDFMVMGKDLIFFWASRMILMSLYTTGEIPFKTVYFTGLIRDKNGQKMSKSKNNGIDPLLMADTYGTDALRLSLFLGTSAGNDMRISEEKIAGMRNFINKLWNASRFIHMQEETETKEPSIFDLWITEKLQTLIHTTTELLENYKYSEACSLLIDFTRKDFCDWYLELSKGEKRNMSVLKTVHKTLLLLLHPFIPFITEVVYKECAYNKHETDFLAIQNWPVSEKPIQKEPSLSYQKTEFLIDIISRIRSLRADAKIEPGKKICVYLDTQEKDIENFSSDIKRLAKLSEIRYQKPETESISSILDAHTSVHIQKSDCANEEAEQIRNEKERKDLEKSIAILQSRLSNENYTKKAPAHLIESTQKELEEKQEALEKMGESLVPLS
jgi:valyl-tRNA synthetase